MLERFIGAVGALRSYRNEVGARPGTPVRGVLEAEGYRDLGRPSSPAWGSSSSSNRHQGRGAAGRHRGPGRRGEGRCPPRPSTPWRASAAGRPSGGGCRAEIERAEKKLANDGFVKKAPAEVVEAEREKLEGLPAGAAEAGRRDLPRRRGLPPRPGALRHALRPRPDAAADDRHGAPAAPLRVRARGGHEREVVHRALLRRDPRAPRPRTGSYTSPHLRSFRERIEVRETPVSEADFASAVSERPTRPRWWTARPTPTTA